MVKTNPNGATKIRECIDNGYITNAEISGTLGGLERSLGTDTKTNLHDEIADCARYYTLDGRPSFLGKCYLAGRDIADKLATGTVMVAGSALGAQYQAAKAFAGSILSSKLTGNWDHLLYWLGKKTVEVSGPDMMSAVYQMAAATPQIVLGMGVGALAGYAGYWGAKFCAKKLWTGWRKDVASRKIANKYGLDQQCLPESEPAKDSANGKGVHCLPA